MRTAHSSTTVTKDYLLPHVLTVALPMDRRGEGRIRDFKTIYGVSGSAPSAVPLVLLVESITVYWSVVDTLLVL